MAARAHWFEDETPEAPAADEPQQEDAVADEPK
jgi:hypothetical protein